MKRYILTFAVITILALFVMESLYGCGNCFNDYNFVGTVADSNNNLLADVQVSILMTGHSSDILEAVTDGNGQYFWSSKSAGGYDGAKIIFKKSRYQTVETEPFLYSEAGSQLCGSITLRRDAVLRSEQTSTI